MKFNIFALVIVLSLILGTQVIALLVQYRINRKYRGVGYWLLGSSLIALGFILMPLVTITSLAKIARIANPILVLGHIFLYIGIKKFLDRRVNKAVMISIFTLFNLFFYYYMYINNDVYSRTIVISIAIAVISFSISYELFFKKHRFVSIASNFTSVVFSIYGLFYLTRVYLTMSWSRVQPYADQDLIFLAAIIISIIISNLWTLGLITMVNQRLNIDNELEKKKLELIFNTNIDAQMITRLDDGLIIDVNDEFTQLSGYSKVEVIGSYMVNIWGNIKDRQIFIKELSDKKSVQNMEFDFHRKDKSSFTGVISGKIINIHGVTHIVSVIRDITERKKFENAIIESEEKYRSILNASPDNITITDLDGLILMVSPVAKLMFGYEADFDDFTGMHLLDFIIAEDVDRAKFSISQMLKGLEQDTNEYRGLRKDKSIFDLEANSGVIYNAEGVPDKMVFIIRDITRRKLIEFQMQELINQLEVEKNTAEINSITDSLTGLYNRGYFDKTLRMEFSRLNRSGSMLSLIMLDIDHFKKYNDTYGHLAGDKCIQMISNMLKNSIERASDIAARYGGEEFIVILPETDGDGAKILAERIRKAVEDLNIPHEASDTAENVTVSVGIVTVYPAELKSPDQALKMVDDALYRAKENGRNRCVYSSE